MNKYKARLGSTRYELHDQGMGTLKLSRFNDQGCTEIYFPPELLSGYIAHKVKAHINRLIDRAVAQVFG